MEPLSSGALFSLLLPASIKRGGLAGALGEEDERARRQHGRGREARADETEIAVLVFIEPVCTDEPSTPTAFA